MKRHVPGKHRNDITVKLVCGSVAGLLGQTFTYPLDVARRQMQVIHLLPHMDKNFMLSLTKFEKLNRKFNSFRCSAS